MLTGELRTQVDKLWTTFWTGGISNPLTIIEQISYLFFFEETYLTESPPLYPSKDECGQINPFSDPRK